MANTSMSKEEIIMTRCSVCKEYSPELNKVHIYKVKTVNPASADGSHSCAADEDWQLVDGVYGCHCKDEYKISGITEIRPKLTCGVNNMKASFYKCQLKSLNVDMNNIYLKDSGCFSFQDDNITNTFSVISPLRAGMCGVQLMKNATHATYVNNLHFSLTVEDTIVREDEVSITISCTYPLNMLVSLGMAVRPILSTTNVSVEGTGQFTVYLALYQDSSFISPYEGSEVVLSSKSMLYIGAIVDGADPSQYALVMKNCYATPMRNLNDSLKYYLIRDSCPNKQDSTINVLENGVSIQGRLSVQLFKFIGDYDLVFLHCDLNLCDLTTSICRPSCSGVRSLSLSNGQGFVMGIGPIVREDSSSSSTTSASVSWTLLTFPLLILAKVVFM